MELSSERNFDRPMSTAREFICPACKTAIEAREGVSTCVCPKCRRKYLIRRKEEEGEILHEITKPGFFTSTVSPMIQYVITIAVILVFCYAAFFKKNDTVCVAGSGKSVGDVEYRLSLCS
jgi:predicted RNA-binding Zn-ribbon protein involved in translation (DUF1610 family)